MEPTLSAGDVVFVDQNAYASRRPNDGDVVVATHPQKPSIEIVKRVEFTDETGVYLVSDNQDATDVADSRRFGMIPFDLLIGQVTAAAPTLK